MKEKSKCLKKPKIVCIIIILICIVVAMSVLIIQGLNKTRSLIAINELTSLSEAQVKLLKLEIEDQYIPLTSITDYMNTYNEDFGTGSVVTIAETMKNTHRLCTIGFADKNGNAIDYQGNVMGNINDRDYFYNVIDGSHEQYVTYLATTKAVDEPRVLFSVPVYKKEKIVGVLFASKEITVLEKTFFVDEFFKKTAKSFVVDSKGEIIVTNSNTYDNTKELQLFEKELSQENIKKILQQGSDVVDQQQLIVHVPIGVNDWSLVNIVDKDCIAVQYQESEKILLKIIFILVSLLLLIVVVIGIVSFYNQKRAITEANTFRDLHRSYKSLLCEMHCLIVEYDIKNDHLSNDEDVMRLLGVKKDCGLAEMIVALRREHPEFNANELSFQMQYAVDCGLPTSFESVIMSEKEELRWFNVIMLPTQQLNGDITEIIIALLDTTEYHKDFEIASRFMEVVPGGMHRCYLADPIHLEFVNDGLCEMLGYTKEEFEAMVGERYSLAIVEEDRPIFSKFVRELAKDEGTKTCEYRMICKDGSQMLVADTMESKRNVEGIMYGYSVIVDLTKYKEAQEKMELELTETKEQLLQARIANANSQMQPHFLYNALASIREIVLEDPEYASDLIFDFSTHLRACIRSMSNDSLVNFAQELDNIKAYVRIEQMRFGSKLRVAYDIAESDFDIIPLGLQPIVENSIRHGIYERGKVGGTVSIKTYAETKKRVIEIADDGVGFDVDAMWAQIQSGDRDSTGLKNLVLRFEKQMGATVDIQSKIGIGTAIIISIPKGAEDESDNC